MDALKKLSEHCQFGQVLSNALQDQFVVGVYSNHIWTKLLTVSNLTLKNAVEIVFAMETADSLEFSVNQKVHCLSQ